jgi:hypothetical protein
LKNMECIKISMILSQFSVQSRVEFFLMFA